MQSYAFDPGGSTVNLGFGFDPAVSPDGTRVAFVVLSELFGYSLEFADIAVVDLRDGTSISLTPGDGAINADGTGFTRLTDSDSDDAAPAFSPDGTRLAFQRNRGGPTTLEILNSDGTVTSLGGLEGYTPAWSPDGRQLAFSFSWEGGACDADTTSASARPHMTPLAITTSMVKRTAPASQSQEGEDEEQCRPLDPWNQEPA